jgi:hypothetical protein
MSSDPKEEIARYQAGTARLKELDVASAWTAIMSDPQQRAKAAAALDVRPDELNPQSKLPVVLEHGPAGAAVGEIIVFITTWVATDIVLGAFKDMAKEEVKKRIKKLWLEVVEPVVRNQLSDWQGLGKKIDEG